MLPMLELLPHLVGMVDADHDDVALASHVERMPRSIELVEQRGNVLRASSGRHPGPDAALDQRGGVAPWPSTVVGVLPDDDLVEVVSRKASQLDDVVVSAIARRGHHGDTPPGDERTVAT